MSDLTDDEIAVIAEHELVPEIVAVELGHGLLKTPKGVFILKCYISDALAQAKLADKRDKVKRLDLLLNHFNAAHPSRVCSDGDDRGCVCQIGKR